MTPIKICFNLSGNQIFKKSDPDIIIEDTGICLSDYKTEEEEYLAEEYNYLHPTTLRDVCVLLYRACGQGVGWQLSREIAKKLSVDKKDVQLALESIIGEWAVMAESDAAGRFLTGNYIKTHDDFPDEESDK